jgi:hypothetical protein
MVPWCRAVSICHANSLTMTMAKDHLVAQCYNPSLHPAVVVIIGLFMFGLILLEAQLTYLPGEHPRV